MDNVVQNPPPVPQAGPAQQQRTARHWSGRSRRTYLLDWILIIICAALAGGLYSLPPASNILFRAAGPNADYRINPNAYESLPKRDEIIPTWAAGVIAILVNVVIFGLAQFWVRNWHDFHHAVLGTGTALAVSSLFQCSIKFLIGGTRPFFLAACKPDFSRGNEGQGYGGIWFDRSICTGDKDEIDDAFESFPSGHSNVAFAGLLFLSLYLNAKTKLFSGRRGLSGVVGKLILVLLPIWGAVIISLTRLVDYSHHWWDILCGAIIGILFAFVSYRSFYMATFDPRFNHIPLQDDSDLSAQQFYENGGYYGRAGRRKGGAPDLEMGPAAV